MMIRQNWKNNLESRKIAHEEIELVLVEYLKMKLNHGKKLKPNSENFCMMNFKSPRIFILNGHTASHKNKTTTHRMIHRNQKLLLRNYQTTKKKRKL